MISLENLTKANRDLSEIQIEEIGCSGRLYHRLYDTGIRTVEDLVNKTENDIKRIPGIGSRTIEELYELLKANDLSLKKTI